MNHVAIDLGGKESQICMRQPDGAIAPPASDRAENMLLAGPIGTGKTHLAISLGIVGGVHRS